MEDCFLCGCREGNKIVRCDQFEGTEVEEGTFQDLFDKNEYDPCRDMHQYEDTVYLYDGDEWVEIEPGDLIVKYGFSHEDDDDLTLIEYPTGFYHNGKDITVICKSCYSLFIDKTIESNIYHLLRIINRHRLVPYRPFSTEAHRKLMNVLNYQSYTKDFIFRKKDLFPYLSSYLGYLKLLPTSDFEFRSLTELSVIY